MAKKASENLKLYQKSNGPDITTLPDEMKDENGKAYAYRDAAGNDYELNFGLSY